MVFVTCQKDDGTILFVRTEECKKPRDCDSLITTFKNLGFKNVAAWAVEPTYHNAYFAQLYGNDQKIVEVDISDILLLNPERKNAMPEEKVAPTPESVAGGKLNEMLSEDFTNAVIHDLNNEENKKVSLEDGGEYIRASTVLQIFIDEDGSRNLRVVEQHVESVVPAEQDGDPNGN
jgi:hypothetical protein